MRELRGRSRHYLTMFPIGKIFEHSTNVKTFKKTCDHLFLTHSRNSECALFECQSQHSMFVKPHDLVSKTCFTALHAPLPTRTPPRPDLTLPTNRHLRTPPRTQFGVLYSRSAAIVAQTHGLLRASSSRHAF